MIIPVLFSLLFLHPFQVGTLAFLWLFFPTGFDLAEYILGCPREEENIEFNIRFQGQI